MSGALQPGRKGFTEGLGGARLGPRPLRGTYAVNAIATQGWREYGACIDISLTDGLRLMTRKRFSKGGQHG